MELTLHQFCLLLLVTGSHVAKPKVKVPLPPPTSERALQGYLAKGVVIGRDEELGPLGQSSTPYRNEWVLLLGS